MEKINLTVTGMKCGGCEATIRDTLFGLDGVTAVSASHKENAVSVEFDGTKTSIQAIEKAIAGAGFTVT